MDNENNAADNNHSIPKWLLKIQNESWQVEMLVSGGALISILALIANHVHLRNEVFYVTKLNPLLINVVADTILLAEIFLTVGFIIHLFLRTYWAAMLSLNSVFPNGIDQSKSNFKGKFKNLFGVFSNNAFIVRLDKLCGIQFALVFFYVFTLIGFGIFMLLFPLFQTYISNETGNGGMATTIFKAIFSGLGALTLIDFLTFNSLKRVNWLSKLYYPIHYFISIITLSFLYRRLYHTLVSNLKPKYFILSLAFQVSVVFVAMKDYSSSIARDLTGNETGREGSFLSLKNNVTENSLEFSIRHIPLLEDSLINEWQRKHNKQVAEFYDLSYDERAYHIGSLYDVAIDQQKQDSLSWIFQFEGMAMFSSTRLISTIDISTLKPGRHSLSIRLNTNEKRLQGKTAVAYFLVSSRKN